MNMPAGSTPMPIADFGVYANTPLVPTHLAAPILPRGARAYGGQSGRSTISAQLPAFAEDIIVLQLDYNTGVRATLDRTYTFETDPGDVMVLPHGHAAHYVANTEDRSNVLIVALPPHLLQETLECDLDGHLRQVELRPFMAERRDPLLHGIGWALQHQLQANCFDRLYLESLVTTMAVHVLRTYAAAGPPPLLPARGLPPHVLRRVCDYIDVHLEHELTLQELGAVAQYSPHYLARLFRTATGQSLHQFVTARRLAKAKTLLTTTDLALQQIAQAAGFSDQSHLSHQFRRAYGCTPNTMRRQQRPS